MLPPSGGCVGVPWWDPAAQRQPRSIEPYLRIDDNEAYARTLGSKGVFGNLSELSKGTRCRHFRFLVHRSERTRRDAAEQGDNAPQRRVVLVVVTSSSSSYHPYGPGPERHIQFPKIEEKKKGDHHLMHVSNAHMPG